MYLCVLMKFMFKMRQLATEPYAGPVSCRVGWILFPAWMSHKAPKPGFSFI